MPLDDTRLGPPVPCPRQVFAVALNYRPHAAEAGFVPPEAPLVFTKFPTCITGPVATVQLPDGKVDWEVEVVAVVGRGGYRLERAQAWDAVARITCGQDLSERVLQLAGTPAQFSLGKSFLGFGPTGPVAVTPDELPDRDDIGCASWLDGQPLQQGRTGEMIFPIDDLVAQLLAVCPLLPGDSSSPARRRRREPHATATVPGARPDPGQPRRRRRGDPAAFCGREIVVTNTVWRSTSWRPNRMS